MPSRKGRAYLPEEVLPYVCNLGRGEDGRPVKQYREFDGDPIKMSSTRLKAFARSLKCAHCARIGTVFYKERNSEADGHWHFNLYAVDPDGTEVLMTQDHIIPQSKGGTGHPKNLQTLCRPCNVAKGNKD